MPTRKELARQVERDRALLARLLQAAAEANEQRKDHDLKELLASAENIRRHLEWQEAEVARMTQALPDTDTNSTLGTMDVNTQGQSESVKRGAGRATRKHPAQRKLYEKGRTITDVAKELGEGRPRVSAWFAPQGKGLRPIPRRHAETLLKRYGIPLDAWAKLAD